MYSSSTSSSECDCGESCHYGSRLGYNDDGFSSRWRSPFHPTMANPLVYYAQVPPVNIRQRSRDSKKRNPNCFVKAFRWYTEERVPAHRNDFSNPRPDVNGFATWLDTKYDQFIRDSQQDQTLYHLKLKQTSTIEANRIIANAVCEPCTTTKFQWKKRSWRKRRGQNKEGGDVRQRPNQSLEYILQPKELSRPISECCQGTVTSYCNTSNATVVSNDAQISKRNIIKSQSLTSTRREENNSIDKVTVNEGNTKIIREVKQQKVVKPETKVTTIYEAQKKGSAIRNMSCQCSEGIVMKVDAETQYESLKATSSVEAERKCQVECGKRAEPIPTSPIQIRMKSHSKTEVISNIEKKSNTTHVSCQCSDANMKVEAQSQYQGETRTCAADSEIQGTGCSLTCPSSTITKTRPPADVKTTNLSFTEKNEVATTIRILNMSVDDFAQTSDHSIRVETDTHHKYPLFMKIICADKPCEEYACR